MRKNLDICGTALLALGCWVVAIGGLAADDVVGTTTPEETSVELVLDEAMPGRTVPWPVTTGVPFPEGSLASANNCRLVDDRGESQLFQAKVAATWDAARSSVRWLTIDFIARPGRKYALEFGPDIKPTTAGGALAVTDGETIVVETGPLRAEFSRRGPAALQSIAIDLNADGRIDAGEGIAQGPADGEHVLVDRADLHATNAAESVSGGGLRGVSGGGLRGDERTIEVESAGPVRCCLRVDGWYTPPDGGRIVRYRTRYHLFAGLPLVKLVDEFRIVGSTRDTEWSDISLPLKLNLNARSRQVAVGWGNADAGEVTIPWQASTEAVSLTQETYRHFGNLECKASVTEKSANIEQVLHTGERAGAWLQARDDRAAVTGSLRWFWQQFPKEWELTGDRLTLHLWSPRGGPLNFGEAGLRAFFGAAGAKYLLDWQGVRGSQSPIEKFFYFAGRHALERDGADGLGLNKHHEVWYHFAPASAADAGREYGRLADSQPLCLASGEWNCSTEVFGPLAARPNDSPYEAIVDRIFDLERYAQDAFGDYGWWLFGAGPHYSYQWDKETQRHYADPRRFEYHTYQRETQLWWCYLRSGERKFYDWAIPAENHWVDTAVSHAPTKFSTEWRGGAPGQATLHYHPGDWSIDSPLHYVRHHDTGEAWLRSASQFWATYHRTLETTTLAYYLTGDERFNDVVELWRDYWGALAGVRGDTTDVPPWHREQVWFQATGPGETAKTWAEMMRDYAPFQSGSRHQMTLFFNLATLYEHTWDPAIGRVVREFADAYLAPDEPNGVWQCQDHRLPANSDAPLLAHYWSPALWKYARATKDPRMPEVLHKYFTACYEADPYAGEVGVYSNVNIAWAWYFTRDPRHLVAAQHELDQLLPLAKPLEKPEDLGPRIYNPYNPTRALTAVPRLIAALADAKRCGVAVSEKPPLSPQRALIALHRPRGQPLAAVTWGWDGQLQWLDALGQPAATITHTAVERSGRQPFDRTLPGYEVFRTTFESPALDRDTWCFVSPKLETGLLESSGVDAIWCWAGEPIRLEPRQTFWWPRSLSGGGLRSVSGGGLRSPAAAEVAIESAQAGEIRVLCDGRPLETRPGPFSLVVPLADLPSDAWLAIELRGEAPTWFQLAGVPEPERWVTASSTAGGAVSPAAGGAVSPAAGGAVSEPPPATLIAKRQRPTLDRQQTFVPGRFGQGMLIVPGRELHIPDEIIGPDGTARRISDQRQGTIEFWVKRLSDDRLTPLPRFDVMENGPLQAWCPWKLPLDDWAHVAVVWRPVVDLPEITLVHIYVDGRDYASYRSLYWAGYASPPLMNAKAEWKKEFVARAPPGVSFVLDDIRISTEPRFIDLSIALGRQQTFNPTSFAPPTEPGEDDASTVVLLPLDGDTAGTTIDRQPFDATIVPAPRP